MFDPKLVTLLSAAVAIGYLFLWIVFQEQVLPGSSAFTLIILCMVGTVFSLAIEKLGFPGLFGSLLAGVFVSNGCNLRISQSWSSTIRLAALGVILLRSGLGLEWGKLKESALGTLLLSCLPAFSETICAALLTYAFLGLPWLWCFMLGFGLSAISPAVIVPSMLSLQAEGYGEAKGVTTMILAAAGLDDIVGVTGFTVLSGFIGSSQSLVLSIMKAPIEIVGGVVSGSVVGLVCAHLFEFVDITRYRAVHFAIMTIIACSLVLGLSLINLKGAGALGAIVFGFVISSNSPPEMNLALKEDLKWFWKSIVQNLLFSLIGATIIFSDLDGNSIGFGILIILISLIPRATAAYFSVYCTTLNHSERLFVSFAWLPKATVQAAVASIPLDIVNSNDSLGSDDRRKAYQILSILVLSIFLTAPLGAMLVKTYGPLLLSKQEERVHTEEEEDGDSRKAASLDKEAKLRGGQEWGDAKNVIESKQDSDMGIVTIELV